jgi:hypothetical protein
MVALPLSEAPGFTQPLTRLRLLPPPPQPSGNEAIYVPIPGEQALPLEFNPPPALLVRGGSSPTLVADNDPTVAPWAARLAQAVLEVVAAERPVHQLGRWVAPDVFRRLDRRQQVSVRQISGQQLAGQPRQRCPEHVKSVHVCQPSRDVAEVSVVTTGPERARALAMRLERHKERWLCTALDWA